MAPTPEYDPTDLVTLTRGTFGISWDVPYSVAVYWSREYEVMRAEAYAKLWGRAHCFAVGAVQVELDPLFLAWTSNGRRWVEAHALWNGFSLSELPEEQREFAREVCESRIHDSYLRFFRFKPLTLASLEG